MQQTGLVFIRSLGDEEHMDLIERLVAECRQKDTGTLFEANVPGVVSLMVPLVTPVNEVQMKPRLMMTALIIDA